MISNLDPSFIPAPATPAADPVATPANKHDADFLNLVGLLSAYSLQQNNLAALQYDVDAKMLAIVEEVRPAYTEAQERSQALQKEVEAIVGRHPEWFSDRKSIVLPAGTVKSTASTKLEAAHEEVSVALVRKHHKEVVGLYLRVETTLNLETLEALDDEELKRLKITRVLKENISIVPAKLNLGKAVSKSKEARK